jgi:hypothetical protein
VINFFDLDEEEAWKYSDLMQIVKDKVKAERDVQKRDALRLKWWQYAEKRPGLVKAISSLDRVLVISAQAYTHFALAFLSSKNVFSHALCVITIESYSGFCTIQSRVKEIWARFFSGTAMDLSRYNPSDCFETFPFPTNWENNPQLEAIGKEYYEYRAHLAIANNQGLTTTYNRFHDPDEYDSAILKLRDLHNQMDLAVLDAYGWTDLQLTCEFLLDYEDEEDTTDESTNKRQKKKPYRYRWADEIRDEVLARLLALNEERYQEEVLRGDRSEGKSKKAKGKTKSKQDAATIPNFQC